MYTLGTIREFHTRNFRVIVDAVEDTDIDLSFDDDGTIREKLESGELIAFCARARVFHKDLGEISCDYLGGCIYESLESFMDHKECGKSNRELAARGDNARCSSYFAAMISECIREARETIASAKLIHTRAA